MPDILDKVTAVLWPEILGVNDSNYVELWKLRDLYELIYASNLTWMHLESVDEHMKTLHQRFNFIDNSIELIGKFLISF